MKLKKIIIITGSIIFVLILSFLINTGFMEKTDVMLNDFSVTEDGTKLTFQTTTASSMGYIRGFVDNGGGVKPHYLTFYSTFGGLNNSFGAKHEFELDLGEGDTEIYFKRDGGGYKLVLQKDADTGKWIKPSE